MPSLPTVAILTTSGTIASRAELVTGAIVPLVSDYDLLAALLEAAKVAQVEVEEVRVSASPNVPAAEVQPGARLEATLARPKLARGGPA